MTSVALSSITASQGAWEESAFGGSTLFGRARERLRLLQSYQRVVFQKGSQVAFVRGESGMGKTALVESLREPVFESNGYFCAGKFFQNAGTQEPYSSILAAFSDLADLVVQSEDFDKRRTEMQEVLSSLDRNVSSRLINLTPFLGPIEEEVTSNMNGDVPFSRLKLEFRTILRALASDRHPILMFFDDIQWMDASSRQLIDFFVNDNEIANTMFVLSYRDEETSAVDSIVRSTTIDERRAVNIQLGALDFPAVHQIVSARLGGNNPEIHDSSDLVLKPNAALEIPSS